MNDTITEINKDTFWGLIRETKDACGQDMSAMVEYLKGRLVSIGAEPVSYTHLRAHETDSLLVCRLLLEKKT